jgi:hypothetical protein
VRGTDHGLGLPRDRLGFLRGADERADAGDDGATGEQPGSGLAQPADAAGRAFRFLRGAGQAQRVTQDGDAQDPFTGDRSASLPGLRLSALAGHGGEDRQLFEGHGAVLGPGDPWVVEVEVRFRFDVPAMLRPLPLELDPGCSARAV